MRIVSGSARGRRLITPDGMDIRPTTDKVKEALFSIIQFEIAGRRVLDLFAGTAQLGLESVSRGAAYACFVDSSIKAMTLIKKNIEITGFADKCKTVCGDAFSFLENTNEIFDIVFLDPPYEKDMCAKAASLLPRVLSDSALVICETRPEELLPSEIGALVVYRNYFYANIRLTVYRKPASEEY